MASISEHSRMVHAQFRSCSEIQALLYALPRWHPPAATLLLHIGCPPPATPSPPRSSCALPVPPRERMNHVVAARPRGPAANAGVTATAPFAVTPCAPPENDVHAEPRLAARVISAVALVDCPLCTTTLFLSGCRLSS